MPVIGSAEVLVRPTFPGLQKEVRKALEGVGVDAGRTGGRRFGETLRTWGRRGAMVAGAGIAAGLGAALTTGFSRLSALEDAEAMLRGLGHSAQDVQGIMEDVAKATEGTAIRMDEAAGTAAQMVAAGIEPGQELQATLRLVADAATIAGGDMQGMSAIFAKTAASNRLSMEEVNQLLDRGIPIFQSLADEMGVTQGAVREMVSNGEVDFQTFSNAMQETLGGSAESAGETMRGALANLGAYLARVGASLLEGVFPAIKSAVNAASEWLNGFEDEAKAIGEAIGSWLAGAAEAIGTFIQQFKDGEGPGGKFRDVVDGVVGAVQNVVGVIRDHVVPAVQNFIEEFKNGEGAGGEFRTVLEGLWEALKAAFGFITDTAIPAAKDLAKWMIEQKNWLIPIGAGILAMVGAWKAYNLVLTISAAITKGWRAATAAMTAAQRALNLAMRANPIGVVITIIMGLVAAIVVAYKNSETFRNVVNSVWSAIKSAVSAVWTFLRDKVFKPIVQWFKDLGTRAGTFKDAMTTAWNTVKDALGAAWNWIYENVIMRFVAGIKWLQVQFQLKVMQVRRIWEGIKFVFRAVWDWIKTNVIDRFVRGVNNLRDKFNTAIQKVKDIWSGIKETFKSVVDWIKTNVIDRFKDTFDGLLDKVRTIRDRIGDAWRGIANKFRNPINWVINTVWNDGLAAAFNRAADAIGISTRLPDAVSIPAFARGGRHGGGWALVGEQGPELVNFSQPGRVYTAAETRQALSGSAGAAAPAMGDLWGTVSGWASSAVDWVRGGLANLAGAILNPIKALIGSTVGQWGSFGNLAGDAMKSAINSVLDWIRGKDDEAGAEGTAPGSGAWRRPSRGPVTSEFGQRWGRLHAGIDIAGGGPTYAAADGTVYRTGSGILGGRTGLGIGINHGGGVFTYYGHNPYGGIQVRPGQRVEAGQHIGYQGATGNVTGTHVHFEYHKGGWGRAVNPRQLGVFDDGGMLAPGAMALNLGSKPEPVLTSKQWDAITSGGADSIRLDPRDIDALADKIVAGSQRVSWSAMQEGRRMDRRLARG